MLFIYRYLVGYLKIIFNGDNTERLLNICISNKITLWGSALKKNGIESNIYLKDFKRLRYLMRKSGVRVHILKKVGLPFRLHKNRKRLGFVIGLLFMAAFLEIMSGYIWIIDVSGNKNVKEKEILSACEKIGITEGIRADSLNPKEMRERLLLNIDSLAWASLNIEGSRLTVNVSEVKEKIEENKVPSNIKSTADGIIKHIDVKSGNCLVKTGDTVKKGDILVSGIVETAEGTEFVKSEGNITALVTEEKTVEGEFLKKIKVSTGNQTKKLVLEAFTVKIPLYLGETKGDFESISKIKTTKLLGQNLPIRIYEREFKFYKYQKLTLNEDELKAELEEKLISVCPQNSEITDKEFLPYEKGLRLKAIIKKEKEIGFSEEIKISS